MLLYCFLPTDYIIVCRFFFGTYTNSPHLIKECDGITLCCRCVKNNIPNDSVIVISFISACIIDASVEEHIVFVIV